MPCSAAPATNACCNTAISASDRLRESARRSMSAAPGVKPATTIADADGLLLKEQHAQRFRQHWRQTGVQIAHRLLPAAPPQIRVHRAALDRAGAHDGHLDHECPRSRSVGGGGASAAAPGSPPETLPWCRPAATSGRWPGRPAGCVQGRARGGPMPAMCSQRLRNRRPSVRSASRSILTSPASSTLSLSHWQT
jgi:hypothetical protein